MNRVSPGACILSTLLLSSCALGSELLGKTGEICHPEGQAALEEGRLEEAKKAFREARGRAPQGEALASTCAFYLGLTSQLEAQVIEASRKRNALEEAARWYEQVGPIPATSEGLVGNLARVYSALGDRDKADRLFVQAIEKSNGDPQLTLLRSYADLLIEQQRWNLAAQVYRRVLDSLPSDQETWDVFLAMLRKSIPEQFPAAVWDAVTANQTVTAQEYALEALLSEARFAPEQRTALLSAVAAALARQHYDPEVFAEGGTAKRLNQLSEDPIVGPGARLILSVHDGSPLEVEPYRWWVKQQTPIGLPPLKVFRELLRSLARRTDEDERQHARNLLELGDRLAPNVPDLPLYIDLAATYDALGEGSVLSESLRRWEPFIRKAADEVDATQLSNYYLVMADSVSRLEIKAQPGSLDSKEYQLKQAKQAAQKAGGEEMISLVNSQSRLLLSAGEGESGYASGIRSRWNAGTQECVEGPGGCQNSATAVPYLAPHGRNPGEEEGVQWARDLQICEVGQRYARNIASYPRMTSNGHQLSYANPKKLELPRLRVYPARHKADMDFDNSPFREDCSEAKLKFEPGWVTSGAWLDSESFLLVDALRKKLLRYGLNGDLLWASEETYLRGGRPTRVRQTSSGAHIVELDLGYVSWLDAKGMRSDGNHLLGRKGKNGVLRGIEDWAPLGEDAIIAIGNIRAPNGTWTSGLVSLPLSSDDFELLVDWPAANPASIYYRTGQPYLAALGDKVYFLQIGEHASLFEISRTSKGTSLKIVADIGSGLQDSLQQVLSTLQDPSDASTLFQLIEKIDLPAGLYARSGYLYMLKRPDERSGNLSWSIDQIDPFEGRRLHTTTLPSTAHHITLIPGPTQWALVERGVVRDVGLQETSSVVFVPSSVIENTSRTFSKSASLRE